VPLSHSCQERVSKAKHIQLVSGASRILFWASSFALDYLAYFVVAFTIFIVFAGFNISREYRVKAGYHSVCLWYQIRFSHMTTDFSGLLNRLSM
jgi:hypothetical protein